MKKKKKLAVQLFITTFAVMTVIIAMIMLTQYLFFDRLYENYTSKKMHKKVDEISAMIENDELVYMDLVLLENEMILSNNAFLSVSDDFGFDYKNYLYSKQNWYKITAETTQNATVAFVINDIDLYSYHFMSSNKEDYLPEVGDEYLAEFEYINENEVKVYYLLEPNDSQFMSGQHIKITDIIEATQDEILTAMNDVRSMFLGTSGTIEFINVNLVEDNTILINNKVNDIYGNSINIECIVSLENVSNAASALLLYYPYFLLFSALCALIVSLIYSRKVSRPIIEISNLSDKMANLEFGSQVDDNPNNEIGTLGINLNTLAHNLQSALSELKDANTKLIKDIEQKKIQEEARKEFVANVSHELKTPLGVIRCYAESLKDNITTKPKKEYYDDILQETEKMTRLVMEMLELSKVEAGDLKLKLESFNIKGVIQDNITMHQMAADEKDIEIKIVGDFAEMNADIDKIDSAISNIVLNAIKYGTKSKDVIIKGEVLNNQYKVSIVNEYDNIQEDEVEKFFDRFYVGDKSRHDGGTGLGLSVCAAIFEAHGFEYGINSNGKTIEVWFIYE